MNYELIDSNGNHSHGIGDDKQDCIDKIVYHAKLSPFDNTAMKRYGTDLIVFRNTAIPDNYIGAVIDCYLDPVIVKDLIRGYEPNCPENLIHERYKEFEKSNFTIEEIEEMYINLEAWESDTEGETKMENHISEMKDKTKTNGIVQNFLEHETFTFRNATISEIENIEQRIFLGEIEQIRETLVCNESPFLVRIQGVLCLNNEFCGTIVILNTNTNKIVDVAYISTICNNLTLEDYKSSFMGILSHPDYWE